MVWISQDGQRPAEGRKRRRLRRKKINDLCQIGSSSTVVVVEEKNLIATRCRIALHFVWSTRDRMPQISPEIERRLHRFLESRTVRLGCKVIALNGTENHVHLLCLMPASLSPSDLMQSVKGASSAFARDTLRRGESFSWQHGYGVFSVGETQIARVAEYIRNQKLHHLEGSHHEAWEPPCDFASAKPTAEERRP